MMMARRGCQWPANGSREYVYQLDLRSDPKLVPAVRARE
jgi:hypothetical protein